MTKKLFNIKKISKIFFIAILSVLVLLIAIFLILQISFVQNKIKDYAVKELSEVLKTKLKIKNLNISFFDGIILDGVYLQDLQKDTLVYVDNINISPSNFITSIDDISLNKIELNGLICKLYETERDVLNLQFIIDAFTSEDTDTASSQAFRLRCNKFELNDAKFIYKIYNPEKINGINYDDLEITKLNVSLSNLDIFDEDIKVKINNISLKDKSGTEIKKFKSSKSLISPQAILLDNYECVMSDSELFLDSLYIKYKNWGAFSNPISDLYWGANFKDSSKLNLKDLAYFVPDLSGFEQTIFLNGALSGSIDKLDIKNLILRYENALRIEFSSKLNNLPDIENLDFLIDIKNLNADIIKIKNIKLPNDTGQIFEMPESMQNINKINYSGITKGSIFNFVSEGKLNGNFGKITVDIVGSRDSVTTFGAKGMFKAENIDMKKIGGDEFGNLTFEQTIDFKYLKNKKIKLKTIGKIDSFTYKNFTYKNIRLYADMYDLKFDSVSVYLEQDGVHAELNGMLNFNPEIPEFAFDLILDKVDLKKLNLEKNTKKSLLSFAFNGNFKGVNIDDFDGNIKLYKGLKYQNDSLNILLNKFNLQTSIQNDEKKIILKSDFIDVDITNSGKLSHIIESLEILTGKFLPIFIPEKENTQNEKIEHIENLIFSVNIKKPKLISQLVLSELDIAKNTKIDGDFNLKNKTLNMVLSSEYINYEDTKINDFYIIANTENDSLHIKTGGSALNPAGYMELENFDISSKLHNNSIDFNITWDNYKDTLAYSGKIKGLLSITEKVDNKKKNIINCKFDKSNVKVADVSWNFTDSEIIIDTSSVDIRNLLIKNNKQEISINGKISEYENDTLTTKFKEFELTSLEALTKGEPSLEGTLNGRTHFVQLYKKPLFFTNDTIKSLRISGISLGDLYIKSEWQKMDNRIGISLFTLTGRTKKIKDSIGGYYYPKKDSISLITKLQGFKIKSFESLYKENIKTNPEAQLWGELNIFGYLKDPQVNGDIKLINTLINVLYLNTKYSVDGEMNINISNKKIKIEKTKLFSHKRSGYAILNGEIKHNNFDNFELGIFVKANNFQLLNTVPTDSSAFYGTAYGTGNINVTGPIDDIIIDINLITGKRTAFFIPLSSSENLSEETGFISYVNDNTLRVNKNEIYEDEYTADLSGMKLNLNLELTPEAEIQLIMDESSDDIIKAKGRGSMEIGIDTRGDFTMFGDFEIEEGDYLFTLKSIISKHFDIKKGGTIRWYGDPENAIIDLSAIYSLKKVLLYDLMVDDQYRTIKSAADCNITMSGKLMNPDINFGVKIPNGFESVSEQLENLQKDGINKQFLSLLIIGAFQPLPGLSQEGVSDGAVVKTGEILTNQLNRWLSDISNDFDVGVNYQSGDRITNDELEVALSTQLWDDRIILNGNVGVGGTLKEENVNTNSSGFVGEVEMEVKLNKQGSVRMKVFNKANDELDYDKGQYTQGVGFFWLREFNRLFFWIDKDKKKKKNNK